MSNQEIYTTLYNPTQMRRDILKTSLNAINILKRYDKIHAIKSEKYEVMKELNNNLADCYDAVKEFRKNLPHVGEAKKRLKDVKQHKDVKPKVEKADKEVNELEKDLRYIEDKLRGIEI